MYCGKSLLQIFISLSLFISCYWRVQLTILLCRNLIPFFISFRTHRIVRFKKHCLQKYQPEPRLFRIIILNLIIKFFQCIPIQLCISGIHKARKTCSHIRFPFFNPFPFKFTYLFTTYRYFRTLNIVNSLIVFHIVQYFSLFFIKTKFIVFHIFTYSLIYSFISICKYISIHSFIHISYLLNITSLQCPNHLTFQGKRKPSDTDIIN